MVAFAAEGAHHTPEGLKKIVDLKAGMNQGRIKFTIDSLPKLEK